MPVLKTRHFIEEDGNEFDKESFFSQEWAADFNHSVWLSPRSGMYEIPKFAGTKAIHPTKVISGLTSEIGEPAEIGQGSAKAGYESNPDVPSRALPHPASKNAPAQIAPDTLAHEKYLHAVRDVLAARLNADELVKVLGTELLYGAGRPSVYGICFYHRWKREETHHVIEISAFNEESVEQLWETVAHELGHALAGYEAGHGPIWKAAARRLGLRRPTASGPAGIEALEPELMRILSSIPVPQDGNPVTQAASVVRTGTTSVGSGCPLGIGTQGGTSRGPGSGSRLRLYMCECSDPHPVRVRVASDDFRARCLRCESDFQRAP